MAGKALFVVASPAALAITSQRLTTVLLVVVVAVFLIVAGILFVPTDAPARRARELIEALRTTRPSPHPARPQPERGRRRRPAKPPVTSSREP